MRTQNADSPCIGNKINLIALIAPFGAYPAKCKLFMFHEQKSFMPMTRLNHANSDPDPSFMLVNRLAHASVRWMTHDDCSFTTLVVLPAPRGYLPSRLSVSEQCGRQGIIRAHAQC